MLHNYVLNIFFTGSNSQKCLYIFYVTYNLTSLGKDPPSSVEPTARLSPAIALVYASAILHPLIQLELERTLDRN